MQAERNSPEMEQGAPQSRSGSGSGLVLLGVGLGLVGAVLAWLPGRVPEATPWIHRIVETGATPGLIACIGLIVSAVGLAVRKVLAEARIQGAAIRELAALGERVDQIGIEMAQVRGSLQELRIDAVYSKNALANLVETLGEEASAEHRRGIQESVFQLAGSMDQMSARIDERLCAQNDAFTCALQGFHDSLLATTVRIDELHGRIAFLAEYPGRTVVADRPGSLGVLDTIEDGPKPVYTKVAPWTPPASSVAEPRGPLPAPIVADAAVASTIAYLQTLFTDERVRHALDHMQRTQA